MHRKVTVVGGAGNVGATVARSVAARELADVVIVDIAEQKAAGIALDMLEAGPLEQSDMVGLDLTLSIHETLVPDLDTTPGPAPLLRQKVADGETGMDAGKGFRDWTPESAAEVRKRLNDSLVAYGQARIAKLQSQEQ